MLIFGFYYILRYDVALCDFDIDFDLDLLDLDLDFLLLLEIDEC